MAKVDHNARLQEYLTYTIGRPCYSPHHAKRLFQKVDAAWVHGKITGQQSLALKAQIK